MAERQQLRYVQAARVERYGLPVCGLPVETGAGLRLGHAEGVIVEPATRRSHFVVLNSGQDRRYLVPLDLICVDPAKHTLRLVADPDPTSCREFDPAAYAAFDDDDLITALFARPAA
jgi:hypothetical protein